MPHIIEPGSDLAIQRAATKMKTKNDSVPVIDRFFSLEETTRLNNFAPLFRNSLQNESTALAHQTLGTSVMKKAWTKGRMFIQHFVEVFNKGVDRGKYAEDDRGYYHLPASSGATYVMNKLDDVTTYGEYLRAGDIDRMAVVGAAAMSNPTIAEVNATTVDFNTKYDLQSNLKDAHNATSIIVQKLRPEGLAVTKKGFAEIRAHYSEESASAIRQHLRDYGAVFASDVDLTFKFVITNSIGGAFVDAHILLEETGLERDAVNGAVTFVSKIADEVNFMITHPDFQPKEVTVALPNGTLIFDVNVILVPLI